MTGIHPACNGPEPIRGRESPRGCEPFSGKAARVAGATCPRVAGLGRVGGSPVVSLRFHHSHPGRNPAKPNLANKTTGRIKGVTANSLRNSAEIGNQPVDGTRRDPRWSLGGRGRVPGETVPGGLYPHSEVGSGGLGCHDDHSRLLGQPHSRVEQAHHPVLHHPDDGHGMAMAKMPFKGARLLAGRDGGVGQVRIAVG